MSNDCINCFFIQIKYTAQRNTTHKNTSTSLNENLEFVTKLFKSDIPQAVAFLVFIGIASSIRESMSASDKLTNFESVEAVV